MAILDRVCSKLDRENLFNKYLATFIDQEKEGIIERFDVSQKNYQNFILLPYLQIIRKGPQITTKIRAVQIEFRFITEMGCYQSFFMSRHTISTLMLFWPILGQREN